MQRSEKCKKEKPNQEHGETINMEDATKQTLFLIGLVVTILFFIGFVIWFGNFMQSEGGECMKSPIVYYEDKVDQICFCNDGLGWNNPRDNNLLGIVP